MKTVKRVNIARRSEVKRNGRVASQVAELEALCAALMGIAGIIEFSAAERAMAEFAISSARPCDLALARGMVARFQSPAGKGGVL